MREETDFQDVSTMLNGLGFSKDKPLQISPAARIDGFSQDIEAEVGHIIKRVRGSVFHLETAAGFNFGVSYDKTTGKYVVNPEDTDTGKRLSRSDKYNMEAQRQVFELSFNNEPLEIKLDQKQNILERLFKRK